MPAVATPPSPLRSSRGAQGKDKPRKPVDAKANATWPETLDIDLGDGILMEFVLLNASGNAEFQMGATARNVGSYKDEKPRHKVTLTKPFYLGKYPVTQEQYARLTGDRPSWFQVEGSGAEKLGNVLDTNCFPVDSVSWDEADAFCRKLTEKHGNQAPAALRQLQHRFALPTEAQWEYACRAGTSTVYYFGNDTDDLGDHAWFTGNSGGRTHAVGTRKPNGWGLYDLHGNTWQWCQDYYEGNYYASEDNKDRLNTKITSSRVLRGGSWDSDAVSCRRRVP